jgi:hypothetical protein
MLSFHNLRPKNIGLLPLFLFISTLAWGQVNITSTVPAPTAPLDVCGDAATFTVSLQNTGGSGTNGTLAITIPTGIRLQGTTATYTLSGGGSGTLTNNGTDETPSFTIPNIPTAQTLVLTHQLKSDCRRINEPVNVNTFTYTPSSGAPQTAFSNGYNIRYAALTILNVTNDYYNGTPSGTFTRTINIVNGGFGRVQSISIDETNTNGLILQSVTGGTITTGAGTSNGTITISNFTSIGNNDTYFDENEQVSFTETMLVPPNDNCSSATINSQTNYTAYYGCYGNNPCPVTNSTDIKGYGTASVGWNNTLSVANLVGTPTDITFPTCPETALNYSVKVYNTGAATASSIVAVLDSRSEFQYLYDFAANGVPLSVTVIDAPNPTYFTPTPPTVSGTKVSITLPNIPAGDSITLTLKGKRPNNNACINYDGAYIYGFNIESGSYFNGCQSMPVDYASGLGVPQRAGNYWEDGAYYIGEQSIVGPEILHDGEKGSFCTYMYFKLPLGFDNTGYYEYYYVLPQGIVFNPATCNISFTDQNTAATWSHASATMYGDTLKIRFNNSNMPAIFAGSKTDKILCIDFQAVNTTNCGAGTNTIIGKSKFYPSASCNSYYNFCREMNLSVEHPCPQSLCEGVVSIDYSNKRISYGTPDANNDNVTDASGSVNPALIANKNVILGDTMQMKYRAFINNPNNVANWNYGYVSFFFNNNPVGNGKAEPAGGATVKIWDASAGNYITISNVPATVTYPAGMDITFVYDFNSGLPSGFAFAQGDSILFEGKFRMVEMEYNATIKVRPYAYVSNIVDANANQYGQPLNQKGCGQTPDYYKTYPFEIDTKTENSDIPNGCNVNGYVNMEMEARFKGSLAWWGGVDAFPYEVRHAIYPTTWTFAIPAGTTFSSAIFNQWSSATGDIDVTNLTPISSSGGVVTFDLKPLYKRFGGTIPDRAEAFTYEVKLEFSGGCNTNINQTLPFITNYEYTGPIASILASGTDGDTYTVNLSTGGYTINFGGSSNTNITSVNDTATWIINVGNGGNTVSNAWLAKKPGISGVTITKVTQTTQWFGSTYPTPPIVIAPDVNGIYHLLNTVPSYWGDYYEVQAVYTNCVKDSLILMAGYDCAAYPTDLSNPALLCNYDELTLYVSPEITQLQQIITAVPSANIDLCDTVDYKIAVSSVQLGTVDNLTTSFVMSPGYLLSVVPNTSQVEYPNGSGTWVNIPNPTVTGSTATWDISNAPSLATTLGKTGLTGVTSVPNNRFNLRFRAVTVPCSVKDGMTFLFTTEGTKSCGSSIFATDQITAPLHLNGAPSPTNGYDVSVTATDAEPCNGNASIVRFSAKNLGTGLSSASEYIELSVYTGGTSTGTPTNIHNGALTLVSTTSVAGGVIFRYQMPAGIVVGDSVVFTIPVTVSSALSCDTTRVRVEGSVNVAFNAVCSTNSSISCNLGKILGQESRFITVARPDIGVAVNGFNATSVINAPSGEIVTATLVVQNTGTLPITSAYPFSVSFYHDADMNGSVSSGDILLGTQNVTTNIAVGATHTVTFTQNVTGGQLCPLMASLDYTPCYCSDTTVVITNIPVSPASFNLSLCPGVTSSPIGSSAITGYTYNWTSGQSGALAYLSATNIANPTFTKATNTSGGVETFVYTLYINRGGGCIATQTITINVDIPANCPQFYGSVGNYVWTDANANGLQDEAPSYGLNNVSVQLWVVGPDGTVGTSDDTLKQSILTANDAFGNAGYYLFDSLYSSTYYVKFPTSNANSPLTTQTTTAATNGNSDANTSTGRSPIFNINATGSGVVKDNMTIDAGYYLCNIAASITSPNNLTCSTPTSTLTANPGSGVSYLWDNGATTRTRTVSAAGTYSVTITNALGCVANASVTVTNLIVVPPCVPVNVTKTK